MASARYYGTGRRKKSIARVYVTPGTGRITVNGKDVAGSIDKGEWVADSGDAGDQVIVDAVHAAFDPTWAP